MHFCGTTHDQLNHRNTLAVTYVSQSELRHLAVVELDEFIISAPALIARRKGIQEGAKK
jgi:hypothetical protein